MHFNVLHYQTHTFNLEKRILSVFKVCDTIDARWFPITKGRNQPANYKPSPRRVLCMGIITHLSSLAVHSRIGTLIVFKFEWSPVSGPIPRSSPAAVVVLAVGVVVVDAASCCARHRGNYPTAAAKNIPQSPAETQRRTQPDDNNRASRILNYAANSRNGKKERKRKKNEKGKQQVEQRLAVPQIVGQLLCLASVLQLPGAPFAPSPAP